MSADLQRTTVPAVMQRKGGGSPIVMVTAYDAPSARAAQAARPDIVLVGDSLGMVVLGYPDTLQVTVDDMVTHTGAVARSCAGPLVVTDMPWTSYHAGAKAAVNNAARLIRAGAAAVKLEGGAKRLAVVRRLLDAEVPVMGHLGLTPQSVHALGGYRSQGRQPAAAKALLEDAVALSEAGCFALVLECVPAQLAAAVTEAVAAPTIGIGAGAACDGQVLVFHDITGFSSGRSPRFVRKYADLAAVAADAVARWADDVRAGRFPLEAESYPG